MKRNACKDSCAGNIRADQMQIKRIIYVVQDENSQVSSITQYYRKVD